MDHGTSNSAGVCIPKNSFYEKIGCSDCDPGGRYNVTGIIMISINKKIT